MLRAKAGRQLLLSLMAAAVLTAADAPRRIVSMSPNLTEILYGIGAFDRLVGISDYCTYPPEVRNLPVLGGWINPNLEKLTGLHPDLVIVDAGQAPFVADKFRELGLRVIDVPDRNIADIYSAIETLGRATGRADAAAKLEAETRRSLAEVERKLTAAPRLRVVVVVDRAVGTLRNLVAATGGSYFAEVVRIAGGDLATPPAKEGYVNLNKEDLLAQNPDVILDFTHGQKGQFAGDPLEAWREMPELKAVRTHRVYEVDEDYVPHASQRVTETAALFARLLHPEIK
ncbi:MAG TPA: helical backbone metal receptor [Verrucomicrobiae bacterium]|nr:helical backbone metal receptor [Verrucomicrobiae bacterium]